MRSDLLLFLREGRLAREQEVQNTANSPEVDRLRVFLLTGDDIGGSVHGSAHAGREHLEHLTWLLHFLSSQMAVAPLVWTAWVLLNLALSGVSWLHLDRLRHWHGLWSLLELLRDRDSFQGDHFGRLGLCNFVRLGNGVGIVNSFIQRHAVGILDVRTDDVHLFHRAFVDIKHPCRVEVDDFDRALADIGPPQMRLLSGTHLLVLIIFLLTN